MCYKDKTFCDFWRTCLTGNQCDRAFTPQVMKRVEEWMPNPPISRYTDYPQCYHDRIGEILCLEDDDIADILEVAGAFDEID
jgi:hypothetical protein